ncbi:hypothetical protein RhiirA5_381308 [Rhizophagus irregularis]|uniref:Uncharacterized protein n=1 Tax=Rhizophagus irregularis TaxID=588596 RepID=A0A2N0P574_9GLOM|nr:hypothetical protein RhiirA5_381308 [Rhizophagus irregularis]
MAWAVVCEGKSKFILFQIMNIEIYAEIFCTRAVVCCLADNERFEEALELETRLNLQMAKIDDLRSKVEVYNNLNEVVERLGNQPLDIERMNRFLEWKKLAELRIIKELKSLLAKEKHDPFNKDEYLYFSFVLRYIYMSFVRRTPNSGVNIYAEVVHIRDSKF